MSNLLRLSSYQDMNGNKVYAKIECVLATDNDGVKITEHHFTAGVTNEYGVTTFEERVNYAILMLKDGKLVDKVIATSYYMDNGVVIAYDKKTIIDKDEYLALGGVE